MRYLPHVLVGMLVASLGVNVFQWIDNVPARKKAYPNDAEQLVVFSLRHTAKAENISLEKAQEIYHPAATWTQSGMCVNLLLPDAAIGWTPIYCFDKERRLIFYKKI
jgi:hypothetical protein